VGDDSFFVDEPYGQSWAWDDLQWSYGAPVSALTFADNTIELNLTADPASAGATVAEWVPNVDYYTLENNMAPTPAGQAAHPGLDRRPGSLLVRAWGTAPANGLHSGLAVEDPAEFTAAAFKQALLGRGVTVTGSAVSRHKSSLETGEFAALRAQPLHLSPSPQDKVVVPLEGRRALATHISIPAAQDIAVTNKVSQNLHAELLLRLLGKTFGADGSFAQGSRVVRQFLVDAGVNDAEVVMNGSASQPASMRPCCKAAGISGSGTSMNFTVLDLPPFLSIHNSGAYCAMFARPVTPMTFPVRSLAVWSGDSLSTMSWVASDPVV